MQVIREKYNREQDEEDQDEGDVVDCGGSSSLTDIDIVRKNLWLMIARKEVILAQRRRSYYREQKISRARAVATVAATTATMRHSSSRPGECLVGLGESSE